MLEEALSRPSSQQLCGAAPLRCTSHVTPRLNLVTALQGSRHVQQLVWGLGGGEAARGGWLRLSRGRRSSSGSHLSPRSIIIQGLSSHLPTPTLSAPSFPLSRLSFVLSLSSNTYTPTVSSLSLLSLSRLILQRYPFIPRYQIMPR